MSIPKICEFCKNRFTAKRLSTRFCSHTCNSKAYKVNGKQKKVEKTKAKTENAAGSDMEKIKAMEFLNVGQASVLLGISRRTIYRLVNKGCLNIGKFGIRTVLKKSDLESFFELLAEVQLFTPLKEFPGLDNCYTISEIQQRYGISPAALYNLLQRYGIAKYAVGRYTYVAKKFIQSLILKNYEKDKSNTEKEANVKRKAIALSGFLSTLLQYRHRNVFPPRISANPPDSKAQEPIRKEYKHREPAHGRAHVHQKAERGQQGIHLYAFRDRAGRIRC